MVPWPSGKAKVCKTFTPQFESGWHLSKRFTTSSWSVLLYRLMSASPAGEALGLSKSSLGGVGGPAGPLTAIVSTGFAGRAGRFPFTENFPYTSERPGGMFTSRPTNECKNSGKWPMPLPRIVYSPSITASIRMPTMMMPMNMYCFLVSFSFRKMRDRISDTTHTAEMMGAAMAPLPLAMAYT